MPCPQKTGNLKRCASCASEYRVRGERRRTLSKYCSLPCKTRALTGVPSWRKGHRSGEYRSCPKCNRQFYMFPSEIKKGRRRFCSIACREEGRIYPRGPSSKNWKGGRMVVSGYVYVKAYDHPNKNVSEYVAEHRLVVEKALGRYLSTDEEVHHRNGVKTDNRIENLEIVLKKAHYGIVRCPNCQANFKLK